MACSRQSKRSRRSAQPLAAAQGVCRVLHSWGSCASEKGLAVTRRGEAPTHPHVMYTICGEDAAGRKGHPQARFLSEEARASAGQGEGQRETRRDWEQVGFI